MRVVFVFGIGSALHNLFFHGRRSESLFGDASFCDLQRVWCMFCYAPACAYIRPGFSEVLTPVQGKIDFFTTDGCKRLCVVYVVQYGGSGGLCSLVRYNMGSGSDDTTHCTHVP